MTKWGPGSRPTDVGESGVEGPAGIFSGEREKAKAKWITTI